MGQGDRLERLAPSWDHEPDDRPAASPASMASDAGPSGRRAGKSPEIPFRARCCQSDRRQACPRECRTRPNGWLGPVPWPENTPKGSRWGGPPPGRAEPLRLSHPVSGSASGSVREPKRGVNGEPGLGCAFAHTMTRGLVNAPRGQVTVLSLTTVTGLLRGPQYAMTSTSFWLHSALHAAASQLERVTRTAPSVAGDAAVPGGPGGPSAP